VNEIRISVQFSSANLLTRTLTVSHSNRKSRSKIFHLSRAFFLVVCSNRTPFRRACSCSRLRLTGSQFRKAAGANIFVFDFWPLLNWSRLAANAFAAIDMSELNGDAAGGAAAAAQPVAVREKPPIFIYPQLKNVVSSVDLGTRIDLKSITMKMRNAECRPLRVIRAAPCSLDAVT
jgi:hypothetical protein